MIKKQKRQLVRAIKRRLKNRRFVLVMGVLVLIVGIIGYARYMENRRLSADPQTFAPLLGLIAHAESGDNYNAYFGNASNTAIDFTKMSIAEVLAWQANYVQQGHASSAVGRYQLVNTTLGELVKQHSIDEKQPFDQAMQDRLAAALLQRRGVEDYVNKEISRDEFAANLAKEWAALPRVVGGNPDESYYAGDGLNMARVNVADVKKAIEPISPKKE